MIECKKVSFSYPPNETDIGDREGHGTLRNIDLSINDGDFVLLCGTSGCGKTTLTRLFNGLIPHYYDGKLEGTVMLDGEDMRGLSLFDISKKWVLFFRIHVLNFLMWIRPAKLPLDVKPWIGRSRNPKAGKAGLRAVEPYKSAGQKCFLPFRWGKAKNRLWICRRCGTGCICFGRAIFQP